MRVLWGTRQSEIGPQPRWACRRDLDISRTGGRGQMDTDACDRGRERLPRIMLTAITPPSTTRATITQSPVLKPKSQLQGLMTSL